MRPDNALRPLYPSPERLQPHADDCSAQEHGETVIRPSARQVNRPSQQSEDFIFVVGLRCLHSRLHAAHRSNLEAAAAAGISFQPRYPMTASNTMTQSTAAPAAGIMADHLPACGRSPRRRRSAPVCSQCPIGSPSSPVPCSASFPRWKQSLKRMPDGQTVRMYA